MPVTTLPVLAYYLNAFVDGSSVAGAMRHFYALQFATLALVQFHCAAK